MSKSLKIKILSIVLTMLAVVGLFWFMFSGDNRIVVQQLFSADLNQDEFVELIRSFGVRGCITLSILSMMQVVIPFMPEEPVQVLTGMGYGVWHGILICLAGIMVGNSLIYLAYKIFGKNGMESMQKNIDLDFDKLRTSKRVVFLILLLYVLPAVPLGVICIFACSLNLKYPRFFILTTLGAIPSIFVGVALGHLATAMSWVVSVIVFAVIILLVIIFTINKKKFYKKFNTFIRERAFKQNSEIVVKKPNSILYFFLRIGACFYRKSKVKLIKKVNAEVQGPSIVLCSHGSFVDFLYAYSQ